ncbi:MAG: ABC transporter ATP-binding protein [Clostridia bacterium]
MLQVRHVCAGYEGCEVLHDISLSVEAGQNLVLMGPNGCGKTTLLRAIAGLLPAEGEIILMGKSVAKMKRREIATHMALLSQVSPTYFPYTVFDTVLLGRYVHQKGAFATPSAEDRAIVRRCLDTVGLLEQQGKMLDTLSGGQLQRVYLARTLAQEPSMILLDEPTNHLDLKHQIGLMEALKAWSRTPGHAVVGVLHDVNLALSLADRALLMRDGKTIAYGDAQEVITRDRLQEAFEMDVAGYMRGALSRWEQVK